MKPQPRLGDVPFVVRSKDYKQDNMAPARGMINALLFSVVIWAIIAVAVWTVWEVAA